MVQIDAQAEPGSSFPILGFTSSSSASRILELKETIEALPHKPKAHGVRANLADVDGPEHLVAAALAWLPDGSKIDKLVNNAGVEVVQTLAEMTREDYDKAYETNVRGTIFVTNAVLPHLPAARGRVVNITSVGARAGFAAPSLYTSSKAAVEGLTRSWDDGQRRGPGGPVESDMLAKIPAEIKELQKKTTPLESRFGTVREVADVVAWLAGPSTRRAVGLLDSA